MSVVALDLPGPSRRIRVEPLIVPSPATSPIPEPTPAPVPQRDPAPAPEPVPVPVPEREPVPAGTLSRAA